MVGRRNLILASCLAVSCMPVAALVAALIVRHVLDDDLARSVVQLGIIGIYGVIALLGAAALIRFNDSSDETMPSQVPGTVAGLFALIGIGVAALGVVGALASGSGLGFIERALIIIGLVIVIAAPLILTAARSGALDQAYTALGSIWSETTRVFDGVDVSDKPWYQARRVEALAVTGTFAVIAFCFLMLVTSGPLGHDESVYAVKARSWIDGTPSTGFGVYRPIGPPIVAWVVFQFSRAESALRIVGVAASLAALCMVWAVGRRMFSPAAGLLAVILVAGAPSWLRRTPEFLSDIAASGLLVLIVYMIWQHFEAEGVCRWYVVAIAPLAAAAFYLRYGVVSSLVIVAIVAAAMWWKQLAGSWRQLVVTAGVMLVLVLPHMLYAMSETGSIVGILQRAADAAGREYVGEGLITYIEWIPYRLAGPLLGPLMSVSFVILSAVVVRGIRRRGLKRIERAMEYIGINAVLFAVGTGLFVHAEERYAFPTILLFALIGCHIVIRIWQRLNRQAAAWLVALGGLAIVGTFAFSVWRIDSGFDRLAATRKVVKEAGLAVLPPVPGDCVVVTSYIPQITWYSTCACTGFGTDLDEVADKPSPAYIVWFENGKRQPTLEQLEPKLPAGSDLHTEVPDETGSIGDAMIIKLSGPEG